MTGVLDFTRVPVDRAERYRQAGWWRPDRLADVVLRHAADQPARTALVAGERRLDYGALATAVAAATARLDRLGVHHGDSVVVQLPNDIEFVVLLLALLHIGAPAVLVPHALRDFELDRIVPLVEPVALAMPARSRRFDHLAMARRLRTAHPGVRHLLITGASEPDVLDLGELCAPAGSELERNTDVRPADPALLLLSSGSTGPPKLMVRTHEDYAYVLRETSRLARVSRDTVYLAVLPASHTFCLAYPGVLGTLAAGGRVVLSSPEDPAATVALLRRERVTHTAAVPALVTQWLAAAERQGGDWPLAVLQVGGAKLSADLAREAASVFGTAIQQVYGMSEGLTNYTRLDDPESVVLATQGRPASPGDEIRVVTDDGTEVPDGEAGELLTRGPFTIAGYFRDPEATVRAFTHDGFYRTGDLVRRHPSGNLVVIGRTKNVINRGGEKICAEELEQAVLRDPRVAIAAVVGVPHPVLGESPCLFVLPVYGEDITLLSVRRFLEQQGLARYKLPERLEILDTMPLIGLGKVDRPTLRARAKENPT